MKRAIDAAIVGFAAGATLSGGWKLALALAAFNALLTIPRVIK